MFFYGFLLTPFSAAFLGEKTWASTRSKRRQRSCHQIWGRQIRIGKTEESKAAFHLLQRAPLHLIAFVDGVTSMCCFFVRCAVTLSTLAYTAVTFGCCDSIRALLQSSRSRYRQFTLRVSCTLTGRLQDKTMHLNWKRE